MLVDYCLKLDQITKSGLNEQFTNKVLYLAGSNDLNDWLFNSKGKLIKADFGLIHSGFYTRALRTKIPVGCELLVGYSLGAAVANVLSLLTGLPCIGFATPNIGFTSFNNNATNYRISTDVINLTPYRLNTKLVVLGNKSRLKLSSHFIAAYIKQIKANQSASQFVYIK